MSEHEAITKTTTKQIHHLGENPKGTLIVIGGHEDKHGERVILREVAKQVGERGHLVLMTVATQHPEEVAREYCKVFDQLGVKHVDVIDVRTREEAFDDARVQTLSAAAVVFFTGGDQLRITSQTGDSPLYRCLIDLYQKGRVIAGTSAGAAAMPDTMLTGGASDESPAQDSLTMAPGLGLLPDVVIDSHFAERGRIGRLLAAVAQNPRNLGIGIDENTAIVVCRDRFSVLGSGAVYVVDGQNIAYTSLSETHTSGPLDVQGAILHTLTAGARFDLLERRPLLVDTPEQTGK